MRASTTLRARLAVAAVSLAFVTTACGTDSDVEEGSGTDILNEAPATQAPAETKDDAPATQGGEDSEVAPEEVLDILDDALAGPDADGDDGRAFGATDDMVITAVESTFEKYNAKAEWSGTTLRVSMDGSVDDVAAVINCTALNALLADGENAVEVFSDGELDCDDPYGTD